MLDHVFTDAIGALRDALEQALLERQAFEERFQSDVLLGDLTWETSYGLPGEGLPPRVRADLTLEWPTWSQAAYRSWYIEEELTELPRIDIEVVLRVQRLVSSPDAKRVLDALAPESPAIGGERLHRSGPTVEAVSNEDMTETEHAIEISYEGSYELDFYADAVKGKIVYIGNAMTATQDGSHYGFYGAARRAGPSIAATKGAAAVLIRSSAACMRRTASTLRPSMSALESRTSGRAPFSSR